MKFTIRRMQEADQQIWAEMRVQLWEQLPLSEHAIDIKRMVNGGKRFGYMAVSSDDRVLGFAEICIREYANGCTRQPVPFLEGVWVAPAYRRQGIGRALIAGITDDLLAEGFRELCSDADIDNRQSHQAHENWGFQETERVVYFRKSL